MAFIKRVEVLTRGGWYATVPCVWTGLAGDKIAKAIWVMDQIFFEVTGAPCTITSLGSGTHSQMSRHYSHHRVYKPHLPQTFEDGAGRGEGVDIRSKVLTEPQKDEVWRKGRDRLGPEYFIDLEHRGLPNEHFHVQTRKGT